MIRYCDLDTLKDTQRMIKATLDQKTNHLR